MTETVENGKTGGKPACKNKSKLFFSGDTNEDQTTG